MYHKAHRVGAYAERLRRHLYPLKHVYAVLPSHLYVVAARQSVSVQVGQHDVCVADDVCGRDFFLAFDIDADDLRLVAVHFEAELLQVQHDVRDIVAHARDRGELVVI